MDYQKLFLSKVSKITIDRVTKYVGEDSGRFEELVNIFLRGPIRVTINASWALGYCVQNHPALIKQCLPKIIKAAKHTTAPDAVKRNLVRLLQYITIPKKLQGTVANLCFQFIENKKEAVAIKVFSMTVLSNLAKENPELKPELIAVIEDQLPYAKPAYLSMAKKVLRELSDKR